MKIKIRYENEYQTLEVENMELEKWLNISISEEESQEDYEKRIQDVIEERFNRPDYNSWHKHDRHTGNAYTKSKDGTVEVNTEEAIMFRAADKSAFNSSIDGVHNQLEYEECCETLRSLLKPAVADMVIAIALDGYTVGEYAAEIGDDANNVSHRYRSEFCRSWGVSNSYKVEKLNQLIRGWINYFKIGSMKTLCKELDSNIRYRLRMCIWKHWKTPQNRAENLIKLGMNKEDAYSIAYTGARIAHVCSGALNYVITNKRLASFGLVSMLDYYTERCVTC